MRIDRGPGIKLLIFLMFSRVRRLGRLAAAGTVRTRRELEKDISLFPQLPPKGSGVRLDPSGFLPTH
jgi:hypothetical protein